MKHISMSSGEKKSALPVRFDWCSLCRVCCLALHIFNRFCCFISFKMALEKKKKNLEDSFSIYGTCYIVLPK